MNLYAKLRQLEKLWGITLYLRQLHPHTFAVIDAKGREVLVAESTYELMEQILGELGGPLPDVVDFINEEY